MKLPRQINRAARRPDWQAARTGQSVLEYALVIAILAVGCIVSVAFARDSFRALYVAHQAPLSDSVSALAITATPNETPTPIAPTATGGPTKTPIPTPTVTATPTEVPVVPTALATQAPTVAPLATTVPTPLPTEEPATTAVPPTATTVIPTPTATATPSTPALPDCDDVPWYYMWFGWCQ